MEAFALGHLNQHPESIYFEDADVVWFSGVTGTESGQIAINGFDVNTFESVLLCGDESGVAEVEKFKQLLFPHYHKRSR